MTTRIRFVADRALDEQVMRLLASVYGPLGPCEGMAAYEACLDRIAYHAGRHGRGELIPTITESWQRQLFDDPPAVLPDYLLGLSRAEVGAAIADYVDRWRDA